VQDIKNSKQEKTSSFCKHGKQREQCRACLTEEIVGMREFALLHVHPDGSMHILSEKHLKARDDEKVDER